MREIEQPFIQECEAGNGRLEGVATVVPGLSWFVREKSGRTFQYFDERHFRSVWKLLGTPQVIEGDGWVDPAEYDPEEEKRIKERERLEEQNYREQVCEYVIRSQQCMEKHGCWRPPGRKF